MNKTSLQNLNLDNDFLFARVMTDETIAKELLEKILGIDIGSIVVLEEQKKHRLDTEQQIHSSGCLSKRRSKYCI